MRRFLPVAALAAFLAILPARGGAQTPELPVTETRLPCVHDSGPLTNDGPQPAVLHSWLLTIPGSPYLRVVLDQLVLGPADALVVSSPINGEVHRLDAAEAAKWHRTSGYFNGDTLLLNLEVAAGSTASFRMSEVISGLYLASPDSICGVDDRVATVDNRSLRNLPIGCTIWLIGPDDCALTAGHCTTSATSVAQANVPPSTATGALVNPPIQDQFPITSIAGVNGGVGNDWQVTRLSRNNLNQSPSALFGWFQLGFLLPQAGNTIRITGYGTDSSPASANQTEQTHTGPFVAATGTQLQYQVDTTGGNSGSPVILESTGQAVGIHTHGGCTTSGTGANSGTSLTLAACQAAIQANCTLPPPPNVFSLALTTNGGGAGNLHVQLNNFPANAVEGFTLFSFNVAGTIGSGALFGLHPDSLTLACLLSPGTPTSIFHWIAPFVPGVYPAGPFDLPAGSLPFPPGTQADGRAVAFSAAYADLYLTNVVRVTF